MRATQNSPVFIHSLFRSGSTYLFEAFRRSNAGYWCYQEPLNEALRDQSEAAAWKSAARQREIAVHLRHPPLARPYFYEFWVVEDLLGTLLRKEFCYDLYFSQAGDKLDGLASYFGELTTKARGRPVIQCCRSSGRIGWAKESVGGFHIYLWRNPWDQWWSLKVDDYFDLADQMIMNAAQYPDVLARLRELIDFREFHDRDIEKEFAHFRKRPLSGRDSYRTFFTLWYLGMLEGRRHANVSVSIDGLGDSAAYRAAVQHELSAAGVTGLDFSDAQVPQGYYLDADTPFFTSLETEVREALLSGGWSQAELDEVERLRREYEPSSWKAQATSLNPLPLASQAARAREVARRMETKVAEVANNAVALEAKLENAVSEIAQTEAQLAARDAEMQRMKANVVAQLRELERATDELARREGQLAEVYASLSWRITAPLRWGGIRALQLRKHVPRTREGVLEKGVVRGAVDFIATRSSLKRWVWWIASRFGWGAGLRAIYRRLAPAARHAVVYTPEAASTDFSQLTPRARRIYADLAAAVAKARTTHS